MRLPLTGLSGCGLLRVFRAACRLSPFLCVCSFTVPLFFLYPFLCRFSVCIFFPCMCPYCFLPVPLVLLAFFLCPTPGCRAYRDPGVRRAETRMSDMSRPGCHAMPFRISVFSFSLPLFLSARMRIYYNVSLLPDFPFSLKKHVLQHICQSAFYKNVQEKREKIPWYIWCVCYKVLLLHPLSRTGAAMFWHSDRNGVGTLTYFFCLGLVSFWNSPLKKQNEKKLPKTFGRYEIKFLPLHPLSKSKQRWLTHFFLNPGR